jgi:L-amino acid N-acyltransferase YncA
MMVPLIDQCDFDVADSAKSPGRMDAGESASDNDDPFHAISLRDIMACMIRNADASDLPAIADIYNAAIPGRLATADTEPVSLASRQSWFQDRDFSRHPIWVFEDAGQDKRIQGWLSFKPFYGRPAYSATAEVSIYVDPNAQRAGVATRLMEHAIERAPELRLATYLAFVFAHNGPSLALCRKFGFEQWGHLPGIAVLDGTDRDLLILGRRI